jgi:hypothetical protein
VLAAHFRDEERTAPLAACEQPELFLAEMRTAFKKRGRFFFEDDGARHESATK